MRENSIENKIIRKRLLARVYDLYGSILIYAMVIRMMNMHDILKKWCSGIRNQIAMLENNRISLVLLYMIFVIEYNILSVIKKTEKAKIPIIINVIILYVEKLIILSGLREIVELSTKLFVT